MSTNTLEIIDGLKINLFKNKELLETTFKLRIEIEALANKAQEFKTKRLAMRAIQFPSLPVINQAQAYLMAA